MALKSNNTIVIDDTKNFVNINSASFFSNSHIKVPVGDTTQRPVSSSNGFIRYNSDDGVLENYSNGWYNVIDSRPLVKNSIRPSLLLDFINSQTLDSRITYSRNSIGSYYSSDGLLKIAKANTPRFNYDPVTLEGKGLLIEGDKTNYLNYSNQFTANANCWLNIYTGNCTTDIGYTQTPDGLFSAGHITISSSNTSMKGIDQTYIQSTTANSNTTFSIYVKPNNHNYIALYVFDTIVGSNFYNGYFDLANGSIGSSVSGNGVVYGATMTNAGNGWYRCSILGKANANSTNMCRVGVYLTSSFGLNTSFAGTPGNGVYIFGAQLEEDYFASSYIPSNDTFVSRNSVGSYIGNTGIIQTASSNIARYEYNPLNLALEPKLLLEPARTNSITYSEMHTGTWTVQGNAIITSNNATAPDGTLTACKMETSNTMTTATRMYRQFASMSGNTTYCASCYFKKGSYQYGYIYSNANPIFNNINTFFDLINEKVVYSPWTLSSGIIPVGNGWYRCWIVFITVSSGIGNFHVGVSSIYNNQNYPGVVGGHNFAWGFQLEQGEYPSSYIKTYASTVTREADISTSTKTVRKEDNAVISGTNFSSWFNPNEGTLVLGADTIGTDTNYTQSLLLCLSDNSSSNRIEFWQTISDGRSNFYIVTNSSTQVGMNEGIPATLGIHKIYVAGYKANNVSFTTSSNSSNVIIDNDNIIPTYIDRMYIGDGYSGINRKVNGHISKIMYYPKRLSDAEIKALSKI
jgi:hypothetical protein